jgi:ATP-binding cassette subfamily B protein
MIYKWKTYRKLPWVRVADAHDCGASAFASVAAFHKHHLTLEQARILVSTDRDGTTLAGLRNGGRAIGLESRPAQATYDALSRIALPAIAHLEDRGGHYVVLHKREADSVVILDPNSGLRRMARKDFESQWSGYVVEYKPTAELKTKPSDFRVARVFGSLVSPYRWAILLSLLAGLAAVSLGWGFSFSLQILVDRIIPRREASMLLPLGGALVLISVAQAGLFLVRSRVLARVGYHLHNTYGERYLNHLMSLPIRVFDNRCVAGLTMRLYQVEVIQNSISEVLVTIVSDVIMLALALGIIFFHDPAAGAIALSAIPLLLISMFLLNERAYETQLNTMLRADELAGQMVGFFDGLRTIKIYQAEERYREILIGKLREMTKARYDSRRALIAPTVCGMLITSVVIAVMLWYGSSNVIAGTLTAGQLIVIFGLVAFYLNPAQRLPSLILGLRGATVAMQRIEEILSLPTERDGARQHRVLDRVEGRVEFRNVSFGYKPHRTVLRDLSFTIEPGETVAVVGETGSGKSSLANLIVGFYVPTQGEVLIDGVSTRELAPDSLRKHVSAVFQGQRLFQQAIVDNITMASDAPPEEVEHAVRMANATFIETLHRGYESQVARGGDNFSGGQTQRIALARALLKKAPILILDEATSSLDGATEQGVIQALEESRHNRTTIVIAHRLSTVRNADKILVLHNGRLVEQGTHHEMIDRGGHYARLFGGQTLGRDFSDADESALELSGVSS